MTVVPDSIEAELEQFISRRVLEGFDSEEDIVEGALDFFEHDFPGDDLPGVAGRMAEDAIKRHLEEQKTWLTKTDCDRLDEAFDQLESDGIVARQNFTCCQTCGHSEIWEEVEQARQDRKVSGYVFFHQQDTERVCEEGMLYLAYGSTEEDPNAAIGVADKICQVMKSNGFSIDWNGTLDKRICLLNVQWRRRRLESA